MKAIKQLTWAAIAVLSLIACGGKSGGAKKSSDLKGEDAKSYLAGKESKYWQLESGHDYYEFITFDANNSVVIPGGTKITFAVNDDNLTMKDYKDFAYKIFEISNNKFVMGAPGQDTLTFLYFDPKSDEAKKRNLANTGVNPKWLRGKYGTTWKFSEGGKMYSYMNDGRILDATTLNKITDWKVEGKMLQFGHEKLAISRLTPLFFDYDAYGIAVKMNYINEANADGSLKR